MNEEKGLLRLANMISDYELREMTRTFLKNNMEKIKVLPTSLSGHHHLGETLEEHLFRTFWFAMHIAREFNLNNNDKDILFASVLIHDIANPVFITEKRNPKEFQKLYQGKYNRSREASTYHPILGMFMVGKYMLNNCETINPLIIQTALAISTHMSHWYKECPEPRTDIEKYVALADYFASRKEVNLDLGSLKI